MAPIDADVRRELEMLDSRIRSYEDVPIRLVALEVEFRGQVEDLRELAKDMEAFRRECSNGIGELQKLIAQRAVDREKERKEDKRDREKKFQWTVTVVLAAAAIVVTAVGIIVSAL